MKVKHAILARYLGGWKPVLSSSDKINRLVYIDGFSGPGKYSDGSDGSPLCAMKLLLRHGRRHKDVYKSIEMVFIEFDGQKIASLRKSIEKHISLNRLDSGVNTKVLCLQGKFADVITDYLYKNEIELGTSAVFAFVDPFGYTTAPMEVVQRLLHCSPKAEVMVNVMSSYMNRFKGVLEQRSGIQKALGISEFEYDQLRSGELKGAEGIADVYPTKAHGEISSAEGKPKTPCDIRRCV